MGWRYISLKTCSTLLCLLPYAGLQKIGSFWGYVFEKAGSPNQRQRALSQIEERLDYSSPQAKLLFSSLCGNIGKTFIELLYSPALTEELVRRWVEIDGEEHLLRIKQEQRGAVLLTAHLGNWEWLGHILAKRGFPMAAIADHQLDGDTDRLLNEYRIQAGLEIYFRGNSLAGALKALRRGRFLGFVTDQDAKGSGVFVDFLGKPASTPLGPAIFAQRCNVPIVPVFMVKMPHGGYKFLIYPPLYYNDTGDERADLLRLTREATEIVESVIRTYPDQWWWFQRRWLTQPKSEAIC